MKTTRTKCTDLQKLARREPTSEGLAEQAKAAIKAKAQDVATTEEGSDKDESLEVEDKLDKEEKESKDISAALDDISVDLKTSPSYMHIQEPGAPATPAPPSHE